MSPGTLIYLLIAALFTTSIVLSQCNGVDVPFKFWLLALAIDSIAMLIIYNLIWAAIERHEDKQQKAYELAYRAKANIQLAKKDQMRLRAQRKAYLNNTNAIFSDAEQIYRAYRKHLADTHKAERFRYVSAREYRLSQQLTRYDTFSEQAELQRAAAKLKKAQLRWQRLDSLLTHSSFSPEDAAPKRSIVLHELRDAISRIPASIVPESAPTHAAPHAAPAPINRSPHIPKLPYSGIIRGISHAPGSLARLKNISPLTPLCPVREPTNPFDPNAICIRTQNGEKIGYLGREFAAELAPLMDTGTGLEVYLASKPDNYTVQARIFYRGTSLERIIKDFHHPCSWFVLDLLRRRATLIHFTPLSNLPGILKDNALIPRDQLEARAEAGGPQFTSTDSNRYEGKGWINLSLSLPNARMMYHKFAESGKQPFVILRIDPRSLLFCDPEAAASNLKLTSANAASHKAAKLDVSDHEAISNLFLSDSSPYPKNGQTELLYPGRISTAHISEIIVYDESSKIQVLQILQHQCYSGVPVSVNADYWNHKTLTTMFQTDFPRARDFPA